MKIIIVFGLFLCGCAVDESKPESFKRPKEPSRIKTEYKQIQRDAYTETYSFIDPEGNEGILAITGIRSEKPETKVIYFKDAKK